MKPTTLAVVKWCLKLHKENILGLNLGNAPGLYFGNFGLESGQGPASILTILELSLGKAPALYFGNFWAGLWASILAILGLNLAKALGLFWPFVGPF